MNQFLNYHYYLTPYPNHDFHYTKIALGLILAALVLGVIWAYYRKKLLQDKIARKILRPYPGKLITYSIVALFLLLFREAGIPYLSMRLWWIVLAAFFLYHFIKLAVTYRAEYEKRAKRMPENMVVKGKVVVKKKKKK